MRKFNIGENVKISLCGRDMVCGVVIDSMWFGIFRNYGVEYGDKKDLKIDWFSPYDIFRNSDLLKNK